MCPSRYGAPDDNNISRASDKAPSVMLQHYLASQPTLSERLAMGTSEDSSKERDKVGTDGPSGIIETTGRISTSQ